MPLFAKQYPQSKSMFLAGHYNYFIMKQQKKAIRFRDLPVHLQRKYKNSIIFEKENRLAESKFQFNMQKLRQRKAEKEKTIEEKLEQFKINTTEEKYLLKVFQTLAAPHAGKFFTAEQLKETFRHMNVKMGKAQIQRMIWEFDEDLNKKISEREFINMYKKCTIDKNSAESKNLFHLTQFLMYCRPQHYKITVEDTLELLFVRAKIEVEKTCAKAEEKEIIRKLQQEIEVIFEGQEKTAQGLQKEITFQEYLQRINKRAIEKRRRQIQKVKSVMKYGNSSRCEQS